jgi:hypothetical protein
MKAFIYEIIATAAAIDVVGSRTLKPFGLTPMTFNILNVLKDGPLSQRAISFKHHVPSATTSEERPCPTQAIECANLVRLTHGTRRGKAASGREPDGSTNNADSSRT